MFKNKKYVIALVAVLVVLLGVGGYFVFGQSKTLVEEEIAEESIQEMSPEEIGLTMEASPDKKKVKFVIEKAEGISTLEYELTYEADSTAQEQSEGGEPRVQRGITGEEQVGDESSYESPWLDLGSCSKNVCRYDKGVESLMLTLKIVKDGKTYAVNQTLEL